MRIGIVTTVFPRHPGDSEGAFIWEHAQMLRAQGHTLRIIAMHSPGALHQEDFDGVPVRRLQYWWPASAQRLRRVGGGIPINIRGSLLAKLQLFMLSAVYVAHVANFAGKVDVIHTHFTLAAGAAVAGRCLHRCPIVVTIHGSDIFQGGSSSVGAWYTRTVLLRCQQVIAVSSALRQAAVKIGVPARHCRVIPNSVDTAFFTAPTDGWRARADAVLFVGSLIRRKGVDMLLRSFATVAAQLPTTAVVIAGEGPEQPKLEALAQQLGISAQVRFVGAIPRDEVRRLMQSAKVLVLPSSEEGQGVVMLEAMACGTPVIGTAVGGIPEVLSQEVGRLVPVHDSEALGKALIDICSDADAWTMMSQQARCLVEQEYAPSRLSAQYNQVYQDVVERWRR